MPIFKYISKDQTGQYHRGEVETVDEYHAALLLRRKKLIVISLKIQTGTQSKFLGKIFSRVSFSDIVIFTRQLATMIEAGLVLSEALDVLQEQQTNKKFKAVLEEISIGVKGGMDFASAIEKHPDIFSPLYAKLIKAGQASGKLDTVLLELAANLEKEREFKSKVRGAMIYPVVVISLMLMVMGIMVFFVMPKLMALYKESGIELPLPTRIMLGVANFIISYWWGVALIIVLAVVMGKRYISTPEGKMFLDRLLLRMPIFGRVISVVILTNFTRTFGLLVSSGLSILESIKIVGEIVGNKVYSEGLDISYRGVERGLSFSSQLLGLPVFPRIVGQMAKTGEETGKLDEIMLKLSDYFESEADHSLKNITTLIEPLVLVVLGIGVGFLILSIILPIYQLTTSIK